mmetsp:Transcript_21498/g.48490  ORF Transcript_21498/g.48490 Transcript_21498/m.48490 type:complete len:679 (-) Transcript_21498:337-2373(-)
MPHPSTSNGDGTDTEEERGPGHSSHSHTWKQWDQTPSAHDLGTSMTVSATSVDDTGRLERTCSAGSITLAAPNRHSSDDEEDGEPAGAFRINPLQWQANTNTVQFEPSAPRRNLSVTSTRSRPRVDPAEIAEALQEAMRVFVPSSSRKKFCKTRSTLNENDWMFAGYHVETMRTVRQQFEISDDEFRASCCDHRLHGGGVQRSGKSGASFFFSHDQKYVLKEITRGERLCLSAMIKRYCKHVQKNCKTLLPVICGAYKISCQGMESRYMVMNNVFVGTRRIDERFDLKGTTEDRYVKDAADGGTLKDLNLGDRMIRVPITTKHLLLRSLERDILWLKKVGIMDYSLLLGICRVKPHEPLPNVKTTKPVVGKSRFDECEGGILSFSSSEGCCILYMGIIDILQMYTLKKKAAHCFKKCTIGCIREIDTVPPGYYADRFLQFLTGKIDGVSSEEMQAVAKAHVTAPLYLRTITEKKSFEETEAGEDAAPLKAGRSVTFSEMSPKTLGSTDRAKRTTSVTDSPWGTLPAVTDDSPAAQAGGPGALLVPAGSGPAVQLEDEEGDPTELFTGSGLESSVTIPECEAAFGGPAVRYPWADTGQAPMLMELGGTGPIMVGDGLDGAVELGEFGSRVGIPLFGKDNTLVSVKHLPRVEAVMDSSPKTGQCCLMPKSWDMSGSPQQS